MNILSGLTSYDLTAPITGREAASIMAKCLTVLRGETQTTDFSSYDMTYQAKETQVA